VYLEQLVGLGMAGQREREDLGVQVRERQVGRLDIAGVSRALVLVPVNAAARLAGRCIGTAW
jgi:hypothetical protein